MGKFAHDLIASMKQAAAHAKGRELRGMRVTTVEMPDVKAIRRPAPACRSSASRPRIAFRCRH